MASCKQLVVRNWQDLHVPIVTVHCLKRVIVHVTRQVKRFVQQTHQALVRVHVEAVATKVHGPAIQADFHNLGHAYSYVSVCQG